MLLSYFEGFLLPDKHSAITRDASLRLSGDVGAVANAFASNASSLDRIGVAFTLAHAMSYTE